MNNFNYIIILFTVAANLASLARAQPGADEKFAGFAPGQQLQLSGTFGFLGSPSIDEFLVFDANGDGIEDAAVLGADDIIAGGRLGLSLIRSATNTNNRFPRFRDQTTAVMPVDLDGDGDVDLEGVSTIGQSGDLRHVIMRNDGFGHMTREIGQSFFFGYQAMVVVDINNDNRLDVVLGNESNFVNSLQVFVQLPDSSFVNTQNRVESGIFWAGITVGNFNGDPFQDTFAVQNMGFTSGVRPGYAINEGDGEFGVLTSELFGTLNDGPPYVRASSNEFFRVVSGDLNGDSFDDIIYSVKSNDGFGVETLQVRVNINDGNGYFPLVGGAPGTGAIYILNIPVPNGTGLGAMLGDMELADIDNDGDLDLVFVVIDSQGTKQIGSAWNDGSGLFTLHTPRYVLGPRGVFSIGDFDGDGDQDLIADVASGVVQFIENLTLSAPCPGDIADDFGTLDADGQVSFGDFLALLGLIGPCPGMTPGCTGDIADEFGTTGADGEIGFGDFLALLGLIGPCP